jgi:hypothetical protein
MATLAVNPAVSTFQPFAALLPTLHIASAKSKPDYSQQIHSDMQIAVDERTARVGRINGHNQYDLLIASEPKGSPLDLCQQLISKLSQSINKNLQMPGNTVVFAQLANYKRLVLRSEILFYRRRFEMFNNSAAAIQRKFGMQSLKRRECILPAFMVARDAMNTVKSVLSVEDNVLFLEQQLSEISGAIAAAETANKAVWTVLHAK